MLSNQQITAVLRLSGPERYTHFVKQVADREEVWGLYANGWALARTADGIDVLPFWPAGEYARLCATGIWSEYEPKRLTVEEFLRLLDQLRDDGVLPGVFYTPHDQGVIPPHEQLRDDVLSELEQYG